MSTSLERGLSLLAFVAGKGNGVSFTQINNTLGTISRASLSRLLTSLQDLGYIYKGSEKGKYFPGASLGVFAAVRDLDTREYLTSTYSQAMKQISQEYDLTCFILEAIGNTLLNIYKTNTDYSYSMQEVGTTNVDPYEPWILSASAFDPVFDSEGLDQPDIIREKGFYLEDETRRPGVRRLAIPLYDINKKLIGILGIGGSATYFTDEIVEKCVIEINSCYKF